jgi:hypothetical protein
MKTRGVLAYLLLAFGLAWSTIQLRDATFNEVLGTLHEKTNLVYKDSFLYAKDEQLFRLLGV